MLINLHPSIRALLTETRPLKCASYLCRFGMLASWSSPSRTIPMIRPRHHHCHHHHRHHHQQQQQQPRTAQPRRLLTAQQDDRWNRRWTGARRRCRTLAASAESRSPAPGPSGWWWRGGGGRSGPWPPRCFPATTTEGTTTQVSTQEASDDSRVFVHCYSRLFRRTARSGVEQHGYAGWLRMALTIKTNQDDEGEATTSTEQTSKDGDNQMSGRSNNHGDGTCNTRQKATTDATDEDTSRSPWPLDAIETKPTLLGNKTNKAGRYL